MNEEIQDISNLSDAELEAAMVNWDGPAEPNVDDSTPPEHIDPEESDDYDYSENAEDTQEGSESNEEDSETEYVEDEYSDTKDVDNQSEEHEDGESDSEDISELYKPFKASGQQVQVNSIAEARKLMEFGVDYYKKTRHIAKYAKTVHLLEKNNITSEDELNFAIDLINKDPQAIKKLLKEAGLDPMDIDLDNDVEYKPTKREVSDEEVDLRLVLERNNDNQHFQSIVDEVGTWDVESKEIISKHPALLEILSENHSSGSFQEVMAEISKQKMLGNLAGLSTLQAYRQIVSQWAALEEKGTSSKPPKENKSQPKAKESDRQRRRKAASPAPQRRGRNSEDDFEIEDPRDLNKLSDDELDKLLGL